jgi:hypothetical protein
MFQRPLVKYAFHMSWFLMILGGASLFEKGWWGIVGGAMLLFGIAVLGYTSMTLYFNKVLLKHPGTLLLGTMVFMVPLILAHLFFKHYMLVVILALMAIPVVLGWFRIRGEEHKKVSTAKKQR